MTKVKYLMIGLFIGIMLVLIPNTSNAAVSVTRNIYSNNGSMKFNFTGLELDETHEYEFGLTKAKTEEVGNWNAIKEKTKTTATADLITTTKVIRNVINATDKGYITIKDKTADKIVLQAYEVDLKLPYLKVTNYTVINNRKEFSVSETNSINVALRNADNSEAYYQYEKITDQNIINKYKEIKAKNGDFNSLQNLLKTNTPTSNWKNWQHFNGHSSDGMNGYGYTQEIINVPDTGLYYMWVYFSGNNIKDMYGYVLVDNLVETDIALENIEFPSYEKTITMELGKTREMSVIFTPSNATNKILKWSSSDETVATVDNAGRVTAKKVGSAIITATTQDGKKKITSTITVAEKLAGNNNGNTNNGSTNNTNKPQNNNNTNNKKDDPTKAEGKIPQTGENYVIIMALIGIVGAGVFTYIKVKQYRDIK